MLLFDGAAWQAMSGSETDKNGGLDLVRQVTSHNNAASGEHATIPSHSIFLGVTARVTEEITGPNSWQLGVEGGLTPFGNNLPLAPGTEVRGPADPSMIYGTPTPIIISPQGGAFTGGRILLSLFYIDLPVPSLEEGDGSARHDDHSG